MAGTPIARILSGSRLYGTSTDASDRDVKTIICPDARQILLQEAHVITHTQADEDEETIPLHRFIRYLASGQSLALECLFAPDTAHLIPPHAIFRKIQARRYIFLSRDISNLLTYARGQVWQFIALNTHLQTMTRAVALVDAAIATHGEFATAHCLEEPFRLEAEKPSSLFEVTARTLSDGRSITHIGACSRIMPVTASLRTILSIFVKLQGDLDRRSANIKAASEPSTDWKSMAHAVRILEQTHEYLETGFITFPRPNAAYLLSIRKGEFRRGDIAERIGRLYEGIKPAIERSPLPESANEAAIDEFILEAYSDIVFASAGNRGDTFSASH